MVGVRTGCARLTAAVAIVCASLEAQSTLSLEQVGARNPSAEYQPAHLNERVLVRGVVNSRPIHFPDHTLLGIEDGSYGALLKVGARDPGLEAYQPGDDVQVEGTVAAFVGMAVIL